MNDHDAMDAIHDILNGRVWAGAADMPAIADIVVATGRPIGPPGRPSPRPLGLTHIHTVAVDGRLDGTYLFHDLDDARRFETAVVLAGGQAWRTEEPVATGAVTDELIADELEE